MKICRICKIEKPLNLFNKAKTNKDGHRTECRDCQKQSYVDNREDVLAKCKDYYQRTRESQIAYRREYYSKNKEKCLETIRKYNEARPDKKREDYLKRNYGIDLAEYNKLVVQQDNVCAICKTEVDYNLVVDHNHDTGEVRGLLCNPCNTALGILKDSPFVLKNAYQYLIERGHYGSEAA